MEASPRSSLSHTVAVKILDAFVKECVSRGVALSVAVTDVGGNVIASLRMDSAQLGSYGLAVDKAFTAVAFEHPTSMWGEPSAPGGSDWGFAHTLSGRTVVFPGGVPLYSEGRLVGGIGVSGTKATVDDEIARRLAAHVGCEVMP